MPYKALRVRHMHLLLGSDTCTFTAMVTNTIMDTAMNIFNHSREHERGFIHEHIHEHELEHDHIHEHIHELDICGWHTLYGHCHDHEHFLLLVLLQRLVALLLLGRTTICEATICEAS